MALRQVNTDRACIATACPHCSQTYVLVKVVVKDGGRKNGYVCKNCYAEFVGTP